MAQICMLLLLLMLLELKNYEKFISTKKASTVLIGMVYLLAHTVRRGLGSPLKQNLPSIKI
jgi:hypothetical protein